MKVPSDRTVRDEWLSRLTVDKEEVFRAAEARLEVSYLMLSVTLDETLGLRQHQLARFIVDAVGVAPKDSPLVPLQIRCSAEAS